MKKTTQILVIFFICLAFVNCDSQCDDCYCTMVYDECIPDYTYPPKRVLEEGQMYYHHKYGVITYNNGDWINVEAVIITEQDLQN